MTIDNNYLTSWRASAGATEGATTVVDRLQPASAHSRRRRPAIAVFDHEGCDNLDQLVATLRRRGVSVVKVVPDALGGAAGSMRRKLNRAYRDAMLYDRRLSLSRVQQLGWSFDDVILNESTFARCEQRDEAANALAASSGAFARFPPRTVLDKFELNAMLKRTGVRTPAQLLTATVGPREAIEALGLPIIVKTAYGAAGEGVRLARSLDQLVDKTAQLVARSCGRVFYQQYIAGDMVMYDAVCGAERPLLAHAVRMLEARWELGPSGTVRVDDDPAVMAAGRAVVDALGCRGFAEIGFIQDAQGDCWHIDTNLRPWGNMVSQLEVGADYAAAYLALLHADAYEPPPLKDERDVTVVPFGVYRAAVQGRRAPFQKILLQFLRACARGPGVFYAGPVVGKSLVQFAMHAWRPSHVRSSA